MNKISTKLNISMLLLTVLILAFVGGVIIINMTADYYREFETASDQTLEKELTEGDIEHISLYLESKLPLFHSSCNYYIFKEGNIVKSSKSGGLLTMTDTLAKALSQESTGKKALDSAKVLQNGLVIYLIDSRRELSNDILNTSLLFLQALLLGIALTAVISFFISKKLTRSIKLLEAGAKRMSEGQFEEIRTDSRDEVGSLCLVFNEMGRQIQKDYDEFERVEKSRREFVANVSHELKTPLTVIKSYSETLRTAQMDDATKTQFLEVIESETDRMSEIVMNLLQLSKLESPCAPIYEQTDIALLCKEITLSLLFEADKKQISFIQSGALSLQTDKEKVKTILTNLISNAVKYSEHGKDVEIEICDKKVTVRNSGHGISGKDLPHIFERFYRTDPARNRETGGTGLGLAIAKESADSIGAKLYAKSIPDEITEFNLEF